MPGFWRNCRTGLRWLRFTLWGVVLVALLTLAWFNVIGLPEFVKTRLVATLRQRDLDLQFTRMRLRFIHGFVAENVRLGQTKNVAQSEFTAGEVQLRLDYAALLHGDFQLAGLVVRDGKLTLPSSPTNALALFNVQTGLRFEKNDAWSLDDFRAEFAGVKFSLIGEIGHPLEVRNWQMFAAGQTNIPVAEHGASQRLLQTISDRIAEIHFTESPQVNLTVQGDARDVHSFVVRLNATAPDVRTPWFTAHNLQFGASLTAPVNAPTNADPALTWWTNLQPFRLAWVARAGELHAKKVSAAAVEILGLWQAPDLSVSKCSARIGGGLLDFSATLNVITRELSFTNDAHFDPHAVAELLPEKVQTQLKEIFWAQPPVLHVGGSLALPGWTNNAPDWLGEITTTASLRGDLALTNTVTRGTKVEWLATKFTYANQLLDLADLSLAHGRTQLQFDGEHSVATDNFSFHVRGNFAAVSVDPFLLTEMARHGFGLMHFTEPLALDLHGAGNWRDFGRFNVAGPIALTNFAIRAVNIDSVVSDVAYTNLNVNFSNIVILRDGGKQTGTADCLALDLAKLNLHITNGFSSLPLQVVGRAIGPKTARDMEPYEFLALPRARVNGCIPVHSINNDLVVDDADLWVNVIGTVPFRWHLFETPRITGDVHWLANYLMVTNVEGEVYGGDAQGWGRFNLLTPGPGTDLSFYVRGTNVDFHAMGRALWSPTNKLEGALSGWMEVTHANSDDWRTWNGFGAAKLHDGLLWDIRLFGLASPVLNTFLPGLGNSRATEATAQASMTNGIIFSDSLEIRSLLMRLQYVGTVDLQENVNAKVTAQLLRNTWGLGPVMSAVLWPVSKIFECQVTGTLGDPQAKPVLLLPRLLMAPLHPIRSVEEMFTPATATNAPSNK